MNLDWFRGWSSGKAAVRQKLNPFPADFSLFFRDVQARTSHGEIVLAALDADLTHHAYLAEYELPNRRVFVGNWNSGAGMERAWEVDVIAAWPDSFVVPAGFREVFRGHHGVLARRVP